MIYSSIKKKNELMLLALPLNFLPIIYLQKKKEIQTMYGSIGVFKIWQVADFCSVPIFSHAFGVEEFEYYN